MEKPPLSFSSAKVPATPAGISDEQLRITGKFKPNNPITVLLIRFLNCPLHNGQFFIHLHFILR